MFAPKAGKQATRGNKLILEENFSTILFYQRWVGVAVGVNVLACFVPILSFSLWDYFWCLFLSLCNISAFCFMKYIGKPSYAPDGSIVSPGGDLNSSNSLGDGMKDVIITTSIVQVLSCLISNYFMFIWTVVPGRALYLLWIHFLHPFIFSGSGQGDPSEGTESKKPKKRTKYHHVTRR